MTGGSGAISVGLRFGGEFLPTNGVKSAKVPAVAGATQSIAYGTSSGQADIVCYQTRTMLAAATLTLDLYTGTDLLDIFGDTAAFRKIKQLAVWVASGGDAAGVVVGGAASNAWAAFFSDASDKHKVFPSGLPYLGGSPAGVAVGTTTKNLLLTNAAAVSSVVGIWVVGTSA